MERLKGKPSYSRLKRRRAVEPFLFMLPAIIVLAFVFFYPVSRALFMSFLRYNPIKRTSTFSGLYNYIKILSSYRALFFNSLRVTLIFTAASLFGSVLAGLGLALLLNKQFKGRSVFRTLFFIPMVFPGIVVAFSWLWILQPRIGLLNDFLIRMGKESIFWFASGGLGMTAVAIANIWATTPFTTLILLAGLSSIPQQLYEAAEIDGATGRQKFYHITIPSLKPVLLILMLMLTIWTFNSFDLMFVMTGGGPAQSTETLALWIYREASKNFRFGRASAIAMVMAFVNLIFVFIYFRAFRKKGERI
ncbi:Inner membrane ABC transporter permease protein YcjO [subsurface metagenome]